jgi:hypothetical protein
VQETVTERCVPSCLMRVAVSPRMDVAVTPLEQRRAEVLLERLDLAADCRLRDEQFLGGAREARQPRRRLEAADQLKRRQGARHDASLSLEAVTARPDSAISSLMHSPCACCSFEIIACTPHEASSR